MRDIKTLKRIVVKVGTNTLTKEDGSFDESYFESVAAQVTELRKKNKDVIIVSSGAINAGKNTLELKGSIQDIVLRQACAAIGQEHLMRTWRNVFSKYHINVAQVLLTYDALLNRKIYINLVNVINKLLKINVLPIINENDAIAIDEIGASFGDNDKLSALVASKIEADLLILLTDIDGLYTKNPNSYDDAEFIKEVQEITPEIETMAGPASSRGRGGMRTKIEAAKICNSAGILMIIANGREQHILSRLLEGEEIGTLFMPKERISNKRRWLKIAIAKGTVLVDKGAYEALKDGKSLLPAGITGVEGEFALHDVVNISFQNQVVGKAIIDYNHVDLNKIKGKNSAGIERILGYKSYENVFKRENLVLL